MQVMNNVMLYLASSLLLCVMFGGQLSSFSKGSIRAYAPHWVLPACVHPATEVCVAPDNASNIVMSRSCTETAKACCQ